MYNTKPTFKNLPKNASCENHACRTPKRNRKLLYDLLYQNTKHPTSIDQSQLMHEVCNIQFIKIFLFPPHLNRL